MDCNECNKTLQAVMSAPRVQILVNALKQGNKDHSPPQIQYQGVRKVRPNVGLSVGKQALATSSANPPQQDTLPQTETIAALCRLCSNTGIEGGARAFIETPPTTIVLCANRLRGEKEVEEALVHELVHAYDFCVKGRDLFDCNQLAYSEVRAARESECFYRNYLGSYGPAWFKEKMTETCIEKNAINATKSIFPNQASTCVASIFSEALKDMEPFQDTRTTSDDSNSQQK
eukprot:CAMPEP_0117756486 /NCGR_PEP_ID=MMETSP0947-20121206/14110_1 /TAXON_ID=44440 /ORGANISM="Chattonella subsalsa, Strain CCMP2191" /LENGTH=230 /DNA_ID=CAMNT_0005576089 /DNA_START=99 /DNA_END=791 /DNA_ORIENTATION=+